MIDKVKNEQHVVRKDFDNMHEKHYTQQMIQWCDTKVAELDTPVAAANVVYMAEASETTSMEVCIEVLRQKVAGMDTAHAALESAFNKWKKRRAARSRSSPLDLRTIL